MNLDKETEKQIESLQFLEQQVQSLLMEKQTVQVELNESENALEEVKSSKDDVYKIIGGIMIKSPKESIIKELEERKRISNIKVKSIEKQESLLQKRLDEMKKELQSSLKNKV